MTEPMTLAEAYQAIDAATQTMRRMAEAHLEKHPESADFNYLIVFDHGKGATTITHTYAQEDGTPDVAAVLVALILAWKHVHKRNGGIPFLSDNLEELIAQMEADKEG